MGRATFGAIFAQTHLVTLPSGLLSFSDFLPRHFASHASTQKIEKIEKLGQVKSKKVIFWPLHNFRMALNLFLQLSNFLMALIR
jgi:hypothetical protein